MKSPKIITDTSVKIDKLVPGGQGIGTIKDGMKGFFWNVLPGETVKKYEITKQKSHYFEAITLEIESPSNHRIEPKDSCYLSTSPWQIMDYGYELEQKSEILKEIFRQHDIQQAGNPRDELACHLVKTDGKDFHYRNKMEYSLYYDFEDEKLHLAFRKRGTHRKIKVETSSIERPEIFEKATEIIAKLNAEHADGRKYQSLLLRCNQAGKVEGGLFENHKPHPVFNNLTDKILEKTYSYSPNGFFQINLPVYEMALMEIKKYIKTEKVLDLYAGVGTIGLSVASDKNLTLVEVDKSAYAELERNCCIFNRGGSTRGTPSALRAYGAKVMGDKSRQDPMLKIQSFLSKSEEATDFIEPDQTVIVDPPRAGLDAKLVNKLLEITPETIIYLSCNPVTQARDVKLLLEKYQIIKIQPFNFFPRTPHLENLIVLERK
ncbi:class I SAM-dependent RNA methyltransferase [Candidatus Saccharibacteria bacterium]|nr:class I SAM-dependent RNA methyltransferase [Candidatus Saccharibacteria bacterium]